MINSFRVPELQTLLHFAGKNKSGRKQELVNRAQQLLSHTGSGSKLHMVHTKVKELHTRRCPQYVGKSEHAQLRESKSERYDYSEVPPPHNNNNNMTNNYTDPLLTFKPLPFYQEEHELLPPTKLLDHSSHGHPQNTQSQRYQNSSKFRYTFTVSPAQFNQLDSSRQNGRTCQLRFKMMYADQQKPKHLDRLPGQIYIKVNDEYVVLPPVAPATKAGEQARHFNRPIKLSDQIQVGKNKLSIKWHAGMEPNTYYALCIRIVRPQTVDDLLIKLNKRGIRPADEAKAEIKKMLAQDADADVSTLCLKVSLLCPLGKMRMITPARASTCTHLQCFDINLFLRMNENKPTWMCPVCDKPAEFRDLQIDGYFTSILQKCTEDEIEFNEDGSWSSTSKKCKKEPETYVIGNNKSPYDNSALDLRCNQDYQKASKSCVIDLTLDSSDEEEGEIEEEDDEDEEEYVQQNVRHNNIPQNPRIIKRFKKSTSTPPHYIVD